MNRHFRQVNSPTIIVFLVMLASLPAHAKALENTWFLKAGASGDGKSLTNPVGSSVILESVSQFGDTIYLIPADSALDGGLMLKFGQRLIGLTAGGHKPVITNSDSTRNNGIGIILGGNNRISNVRIEGAFASGIYGYETADIHIDGVVIHGANQSESFIDAKYPNLPGSLPHGGMVFVHSESSAKVNVTSSIVSAAAGFGIVSITSDAAVSSLSVSDTQVEGGTKIGFFDAGISALVQGPVARVDLDVTNSQVWGRLSRSGRNIMVVASGGAQAHARVERVYSGRTGQDGIVMAVMQSPSEIHLKINDSLIEGAGQMNVEGTLVNLETSDPNRANEGRVSIEIDGSIIRNAGSVKGFEEVAANIWLGGSQFLEDRLPAEGEYKLQITDSRIEGAGRVGLELGELGQLELSQYDVVLRGNTMVNNGEAEVMLHVPNASIDAQKNCWGQLEGLQEQRLKVFPPAKVSQLNAKEPIGCLDKSKGTLK